MADVAPGPRKRLIGSAWELALWLVAAMILAGVLLLVPVARTLDPVLAVGLTEGPAQGEFRLNTGNLDQLTRNRGGTPERRIVDALVDPWGRPFRWRPEDHPAEHSAGSWRSAALYSVGPNGLDEDGQGDDVDTVAIWSHPARDWLPRAFLFLPRDGLVLMAGSLIVCAVLTARWARALRSSSPGVDVLRALLLAAWPASWGAFWAFNVRDPDTLLERVGVAPLVWLGGGAAVALTWAALWLVPALAYRLSRPR